MKRCVVQLNDGSYFNVKADRMGKNGDFLWIFDGDRLVAMADLGAVIAAHISTKGGNENANETNCFLAPGAGNPDAGGST